jgi:hypothetical protein
VSDIGADAKPTWVEPFGYQSEEFEYIKLFQLYFEGKCWEASFVGVALKLNFTNLAK